MYEFDKFRFDPENHLLSKAGTPVSLTPKVFELLLVLVQNAGRLTTKEELMSKLWPDSLVEEANLTVNICALRKVLGEADDARHYIETVPKKGYRFVVPITKVIEDVASHETKARDGAVHNSVSERADEAEYSAIPTTKQEERRPKRKIWFRLGIVGLGLLFTLVGVASYVTLRSRITPKRPSTQPHRLAVLPFENLRGDAQSEFLGFSLADAIITKLGYVSELAVRPSYAVQKYRTRPIDISKVARDLKVDTLLTGTFLTEGDDLRIACQLIDVKAENILWKGTFDLKYDRLLAVQDRVAQQIIKGLELTLSLAEVARVNNDGSITPLAYEYYLRGIDLYSTSDFPMAIKMLEKSAELAADYALTWANLGRTYTANASFRFGGVEQYRKAQEAFERSLALQPDQIDARIYMANMLTDTGRVEKAVPLLREALKTNPNHAEIHWELGYAYRFAGMLNQSVAECERARQLDPVVKLNSSTLNAYLYLGQYDKFLASLPKTDDVALIAFYRGLGAYYKKDLEHAVRDFDHALELDRSLFHAQVGKALSLGIRHQVPQGIDILRAMETRIDQRGVGDPEAIYKIAQAYALLGDKPAALRIFKRSIEMGFFSYPYFLKDPLLDSLRKDSDLEPLINKARLRHEAFVKSFF